MSELIQTAYRRGTRWQLLATASGIALACLAFGEKTAEAANAYLTDSDHPAFWIELGGDFAKVTGKTEQWLPVTGNSLAGSGYGIRKDPSGSLGLEGKISYWLNDWVVSASARYGRSQRDKKFHSQSSVLYFYNATSRHTENHLIADFEVGKDVGLGLLDKGHSILSAGVRIAQFNNDSTDLISSNLTAPYGPHGPGRVESFKTAKIRRRASLLGPIISWDAGLPLVASEGKELSLDWGASGAVLFGRQKTTANLKSQYYHNYIFGDYSPIIRTTSVNPDRRISKIVPNIAAFAGMSFHLPAASISVGYQADIYFGAVDGGIAAKQDTNRSFHGPYATISIGLP